MNTKSRPAKNNYVPGASRQPRSVATLRAQMDDLARGERIKARRQALRLTQPAVVDLLAKKAGGQVVTLRGYQTWEAGGGIRWDNAKVLAEVLGVDAEKLMVGGPYVDTSETPDPFADDLPTRLDRIEDKLNRLLHMVDEGLFTPREGQRDEQIGIAAAVDRLRAELAPQSPPARTPAGRAKRRAAG